MERLIKYIETTKSEFQVYDLEQTKVVVPQYLLIRFVNQLASKNYLYYLKSRTLPYFKEETKVAFDSIWKTYNISLNSVLNLNDEQQMLSAFTQFLAKIDLESFLLILGQRLTPASITTSLALPPTKDQLKITALLPYNTEIKMAVRAWEKHVGRNENNFWGTISGSPSEKELHVISLIDTILNEATWWNVFEHYKHELIYEVRIASGHGMRWQLNELTFIGFVEPFEFAQP